MKRFWSTFLVSVLLFAGFTPAANAATEVGEPELVRDIRTTAPDFFDYSKGFLDSIDTTRNETNSVVLGGKTFFIGPSEKGHNGLYVFSDSVPGVFEVSGPDGSIVNVSKLLPLGTSKLIFKLLVGSSMSIAIYDIPTASLQVFDQLRLRPGSGPSDLAVSGSRAVFFAAGLASTTAALYLIDDSSTQPTMVFEPGVANLELRSIAIGSDGVYFVTGENAEVANYLPIDFANNTPGQLQTLTVTSGDLEFFENPAVDLMLFYYRDGSSNYVFGYVKPGTLTLVKFFDRGQIAGSEGVRMSGPRVMMANKSSGAFVFEVHQITFDRSVFDPQNAATNPVTSVVFSGSGLGLLDRVLFDQGTKIFFKRSSGGNNESYWIKTLDGNTNPEAQLTYDQSTNEVDGDLTFFFAEQSGEIRIGQKNPTGSGFEILKQSGTNLAVSATIAPLKSLGGISLVTANDQTLMFRDSGNRFAWTLQNNQLTQLTSGSLDADSIISTPQGMWLVDYTGGTQNLYHWRDGVLSQELATTDFTQQVDLVKTFDEGIFLAGQNSAEIKLYERGSGLTTLTGPWTTLTNTDWEEFDVRPTTGAQGVMEASAVARNPSFDSYLISRSGGWVISTSDLPGCRDIGNTFFVADSYFVSCYNSANSQLQIHKVELSDSSSQTTLSLAATLSYPESVSFVPMGELSGQMFGHLYYTAFDPDTMESEIPNGIFSFNPQGSQSGALTEVPGSSAIEPAERFVFTSATAPIVAEKLWFVGINRGDDFQRSTSAIYSVTPTQTRLEVPAFLADDDAISSEIQYLNGALYAAMDHPAYGEELFRIPITETESAPSSNNQNNDNEPTPEIIIVPSTPTTTQPPSAGGVTITDSNIRPGGDIILTTTRQLTEVKLGESQLFFRKAASGYQILLPQEINTAATITLNLTTTSGQLNISIEARVQTRQLDNQVDSVIKRTGNSARVVLYDLVDSGKAQVFVNGKEIAWIRATSDSDPKLREAPHGKYLVRTFDLAKGKNVIEIYQDGERLRRVSYSR